MRLKKKKQKKTEKKLYKNTLRQCVIEIGEKKRWGPRSEKKLA